MEIEYGQHKYIVEMVFDTQEEADKFTRNLKKYKWHDLRKNPDDLPTDENVRYLIYATVKPICKNRYYTAKLIRTYDGIYSLCPSPFLDVDVIAWRYIELFEVEE